MERCYEKVLNFYPVGFHPVQLQWTSGIHSLSANAHIGGFAQADRDAVFIAAYKYTESICDQYFATVRHAVSGDNPTSRNNHTAPDLYGNNSSHDNDGAN
jgi:hypothetical protein